MRWYLAYNLSLRDLKEKTMAERGIGVDHSTIRWVIQFAPRLLERFNRRKRAVMAR